MARTVIDVFRQTAKEHGQRPALSVKREGSWHSRTWQQYHDETMRAARAFIKLGLEPGQGVSIIGYNSPEWFMADIGAIAAGGVPAGIYTTSSAEQCQYITDHCDARVVIVEDDKQLAKFKAVRDQLPKVSAIVMIKGDDPADDIYSWDAFCALGDGVDPAQLEARISAQEPEDLCTLIYTSGTTGPPKAVMISHDNITWVAEVALGEFGLETGDCVLSYLPLSHIAEQAISLHGPMHFGGSVYFAESIDLLGDNLREVRPHLFLGVPRVWEKIQAKMESRGAKNSFIKKQIARWARGKGLAGGYAEQQGKPLPFGYGLAHKLVFSKVREALGLDRCRIQITSAAPISLSTLEFFLSLGIKICEVYGMSECTGPATLSLPHKMRTGRAGYCVPGAELEIAADGEVRMRGRHVFMGYLKNEEATTAAKAPDGWLHSGDIGEIDAEGFLKITDRKKDLLITAGGENIAPQLIEGKLKSIPLVAAAVVIGDRRKFLAALLTLDPDKLAAACEQAGSPAGDSLEHASRCEILKAYLEAQVEVINKDLARAQTIKKICILPGEFSIDGGELTPTMKVKRKAVNEKYAEQIEGFYEGL